MTAPAVTSPERTPPERTPPEGTPFWSALFTDRRIAPALGLGFTSGIPFLLVYGTQAAWLSDAGISIAAIGLLSEMTLAYKFKFLWAPFLDRYDPPLLGARLGRRRGWIVVALLSVMAMLAGIAFGDPAQWLAWTIAFSVALGFAGATLDLVIDGWRITSVRPPEKQAVLSSWTEIGWRIGNLAAGAGALFLADRIGWRGAYLCMGALMLVGMLAALFAPEPPSDQAPHPARAGFVDTVWAPIRDLLRRLGPMAPAILLLVAGFRMPGYVATAMAVPLFKHQGFSNTDIATVTKLFGFWIGLGGTFLAGALIPRIGMLPSLLIGTIAASASHLSLAYLAAHGGDGGQAFWTFAVTVGIDGFAYAFASVVLITYMSTLASTEHAASQFGLLTSLCAFPGSVLAGFSGFIVERTGFPLFFVLTSLIGVPVALLAVYVWAKVGISDEAPAKP
ncbi:AmpG family muropeptide MFS transporter [Methylobacterium nonmethylotrophicum]|uniref:MFS transporter n=1 Tax=Methylobacterium nonmethylotrophicum TaxID=1141884 RepID=A0A4Z0NP99_9HYPH|nr:MFS transporter [Methylobacterium nonmethylotrophicum]TGD98660.1 MFS transporter [Methylobacterium nonmethylotrophicum]